MHVRVRAHNGFGASAPSNEISSAVQCTDAPGAPSLSGSVDGQTVTLSWSAPAGGCAVTSYVMEAGSSPGASDLLQQDTGTTATSFSVSNVAAGTYYVRVRARNGNGDSGPSNEISGTVGP